MTGLAADASKAGPCGLVPGPQIDGTAIGAGGLGLVPQTLVSRSPYQPCLRVLRIGLHGLIEIGGGFLRLVEREIALGAGQQRLGLLRHQAV